MAKNQLQEIQELEASLRELHATVSELRALADTVDDPELRSSLLEAANGTEASARKMIAALEAMRKSIQ
jgi:hypothetical protein